MTKSYRFSGRKDNFNDHWSRQHKGQSRPKGFKWPTWKEVMRTWEAAEKLKTGDTLTTASDLGSTTSDSSSYHFPQSNTPGAHSVDYSIDMDLMASANSHLGNPEIWSPIEPASAIVPVPNPSQKYCQSLLDRFQDLFPLPDGTVPFQIEGQYGDRGFDGSDQVE
jgi:hypothetical protein